MLGDGNHFATPFREYDPRVARWWSNDPIVHPWESPYAAMAGNPVRFTDPFGADTTIYSEKNGYAPEVRKGPGEAIIVRASRWSEMPSSIPPAAEEQRIQQENLAIAQRAWGETKDRLTAKLDADHAGRDRENSSVFQDLSWNIQDLVNLGVVGLSDASYLERGIVRCQTCEFVPGISLLRAGLVIRNDGLSWGSGLTVAGSFLGLIPVAGVADDALRVGGGRVLKLFKWSSRRLKAAEEELLSGATAVTVRSRAEAEELFLGIFNGAGMRNSTGLGSTAARDFFAGENYYHWDDVFDDTGRLVMHGLENPHGLMPHLQIHMQGHSVIRIFFPARK